MDKRITMKKYQLTGILLFIFCLNSLTLLAEEATDFADDVEDVPAAPIDNWIPYAIVLVVVFAYIMLNKKTSIAK
nr:hypothetical protein [uncultured Flavobacterium sp.]